MKDGARPDGPAGYLELLRGNLPFRRLFLARVVSLFGDWFNLLAALVLLRQLGGEDASRRSRPAGSAGACSRPSRRRGP
ncbi:MAG: hypothetical protein AB7N76_23100 [Planctomycetota bacterium]